MRKIEIPISKIYQAATIKRDNGIDAAADFMSISRTTAEMLFRKHLSKEEKKEFRHRPLFAYGKPQKKIGIKFDASEASEQIFDPSEKYCNLSHIFE